MSDPGSIAVQALLFSIFAALTGILAAIIGPMYDNLLVPELSPSSLYPSLTATGGSSYLSVAASFSTYLVIDLVDPLVGVVGLAVALAYLGRSFLGRAIAVPEPLLARLVLAVLVANFTLPIAGAVLDLAAATYPVIAGFDGGAWQQWSHLAGYGALSFSWDNGALAFVVTFAIFSIVMLLAAAVALRNALLGVLVVLLPIVTLLWPIPTLAPLARRGWLMFGELAFLPCVLVIPLELAVGSSNVLLLLGYLTVALSSPSLISLAGAQLSSAGFPSAGGVVANGFQRGLGVASSATSNWIRPLGRVGSRSGASGATLASAGRALGGSAFPAALPLVAADFLGQGAAHLVRHIGQHTGGFLHRDRFPSTGGYVGGGRPRG